MTAAGLLTAAGDGAGRIRNVPVITNPEHASELIQLLGSGREFGLKLNYELQEEARDSAQAVGLAEEATSDATGCSRCSATTSSRTICAPRSSASRPRNTVPSSPASRSSAPAVQHDRDGGRAGRRDRGETKPAEIAPDPDGIYMYDEQSGRDRRTLEPSGRGELGITDLNDIYVREGTMRCGPSTATGSTPAPRTTSCSPPM